MYRSHDATVRHDKVYALLGLCADDPKASKGTTYILGGKCSVQTWPDTDIAVIKGKGWILGYIAQVRSRTSEDDQAYVSSSIDILWR
ncbi:hypothetical protein AO1008_09606 [Aspergillus oryzae 100-8]|uniref:Uncharacterized protein n=1 Tax=Aspergillus oryzae (strain 3.042) TaxID=1160506 RepID=I7ZZ42_ASPO3|nr:hypothetical protein Ao3042_06118 [Aspergillus oryzae 3.042]KDE83001.1 hypothetical protein AO1008_09606 [Aspergillus oryzae 100-8]|eukprot:EIT77619.1 hypothetical protein Ao3042_06118 [Aspergillus oryzae 3.042]